MTTTQEPLFPPPEGWQEIEPGDSWSVKRRKQQENTLLLGIHPATRHTLLDDPLNEPPTCADCRHKRLGPSNRHECSLVDGPVWRGKILMRWPACVLFEAKAAKP